MKFFFFKTSIPHNPSNPPQDLYEGRDLFVEGMIFRVGAYSKWEILEGGGLIEYLR